MIKTAIIYNHRGRFGKDGAGPIEVRVTEGRRAYYINTGVCVRPREWKFGKIVTRCDSDELNDRVAIMLKRVDEVVNDYLEREQELNIDEVRRRVKSPDGRRRLKDAEDMIAWMKSQIPLLDVAHGTRNHYRVSVAALVDSGSMKRWKDLTIENVHKFDAYLHTIKKHQTDAEVKAKKPVEYISQATVRNYHKDIKALLTRALKFGMITANPYDRMKGEIKRGDRETVEFLTEDERVRIEELELTEGSSLSVARDLFIFQSFTGMSYSDMQAFSLEDCRFDGDKVLFIGQRIKTHVTFWVQLLPPALAAVEKYGCQMPRVAVQVYNRNLKALAEMAKIRKKVTSHVARHTFATWMLSNGAKIENVSKMLGHTDVKMTQRYAKVLAKDVFSEFEKVKQLKQNDYEESNDGSSVLHGDDGM